MLYTLKSILANEGIDSSSIHKTAREDTISRATRYSLVKSLLTFYCP